MGHREIRNECKKWEKDSKMHRYKHGSRKLLKSQTFYMQKRKVTVLHSKMSEKKQDICLHKLMQDKKLWQSSGRECYKRKSMPHNPSLLPARFHQYWCLLKLHTSEKTSGSDRTQHLIPSLSMKEKSTWRTPGRFSWFKIDVSWNNQRKVLWLGLCVCFCVK